jgi:hypothetical protein
VTAVRISTERDLYAIWDIPPHFATPVRQWFDEGFFADELVDYVQQSGKEGALTSLNAIVILRSDDGKRRRLQEQTTNGESTGIANTRTFSVGCRGLSSDSSKDC